MFEELLARILAGLLISLILLGIFEIVGARDAVVDIAVLATPQLLYLLIPWGKFRAEGGSDGA
jgi:hypothetical protein